MLVVSPTPSRSVSIFTGRDFLSPPPFFITLAPLHSLFVAAAALRRPLGLGPHAKREDCALQDGHVPT